MAYPQPTEQAMTHHLCIHGHFYQPPREDPWLGEVLPEGSAAPGENWNERICRESYAPLAYARLLDDGGNIREIINAYEWISFNFGPTLLSWMQRHAQHVYDRVLEGDRLSRKRWGFGNAMAQVRHHVILPLATDRERRLEVAWAIQDFAARYERHPDGMWLAETAVDTASLEALAEAGIAYTVLAPRQAQAVAAEGGDWHQVDENSLDIYQPYRVDLPSGRSICVFFYHGGLSQAVAFERLLADGGGFWSRVRGEAREGLLSMATDGETYGHHFTFGEMALAFLLHEAQRDDDIGLTNYAAYLAATPPSMRVRINEESSWSCAHGVERWRSDCGCNAEGKTGWNQQWRRPLREALRMVKDAVDAHFDTLAGPLFTDAEAALTAYGEVLGGGDRAAFEATWFKSGIDARHADTARRLLEMQRYAQASFASCAWFFDDLDRIEPLNAMGNALRAMELAGATGLEGGAEALEAAFASKLGAARSNPTRRNPEGLNGDNIYATLARPRRENCTTLVAQALLTLWARTHGDYTMADELTVSWPGAQVAIEFGPRDAGHTATGEAIVTDAANPGGKRIAWEWKPAQGTNVLSGQFRTGDGQDWFSAADLAWGKRQAIALAWAETARDKAWTANMLAMQTGRDLFLERAQSQETQNRVDLWEPFRPVLAWMWITGEVGGELLEAFLKTDAMDSATRADLAKRVATHMLDALAAPSPDWDALEAQAHRVATLCPGMDWWPIQNRLHALLPTTSEAARLARTIGFS